MITSLSGIRGIPNKDLGLTDALRFASKFAAAVESREFLVARDTRSTGPALVRAVVAGLMSRGGVVHDYGIISTPALFRASRLKELPAVMVTASHNEPEFNGLKFLIGGSGIGTEVFGKIVDGEGPQSGEIPQGNLRSAARPTYEDDLLERFGAGSFQGVKVALDLGGGAAIVHAVPLLRRLGCDVSSVNDTLGVFNRRVDPVADELALLTKVTKGKGCDIGLGFDCDGDRLVIVDSDGKKRTGDFMLTLALAEALRETGDKRVVVSLDTTQAIEEVAKKSGAVVYRSKVGEANLVNAMKENRARLGGEGSSGGLVDGSFNYCRDSMMAALLIMRALKREGRKFYVSVPAYRQERVATQIPRKKAENAIRRIAKSYGGDTTDGVKVELPGRSWVLIRPSGTEDLVRVSAEAPSSAKAAQIVRTFSRKLRELSR